MNIKRFFLPLILPIIVLIFIIYLSYTPPNATAAESGRWEKPQLLSEVISTKEIESRPTIVIDRNGNAIAVWIQLDGEQNNIWAAHYVKGKGWEKPQIIEKNMGGISGINRLSIIMDSKDNASVIWFQSTGNASLFLKGSIWVKQYDTIKGWRPAEPVEINIKTNRHLEVAANKKDNVFLIWTQIGKGSDSIWAKRYEIDKGWHPAEPIETDCQEPHDLQIVTDANDNATLVFSQRNKTTHLYGIYAKQYKYGKGWEKAELIQKDTKEASFSPSIAIDINSNIYVLWYQYLLGKNGYEKGKILFAHYKADKKNWDSPQIIQNNESSMKNFFAIDKDIAVDTNGNVLAIWTDYNNSKSFNIRTTHHEAGKGWDFPQVIQTDNGFAYNFNIVVDGHGNALAMWSQYSYNSKLYSIWASRYEKNKDWSHPQIIGTGIESGYSRPNIYDIVIDANGNAIAIWKTQKGNKISIYASRFVKEK